MSDVLRVSWGVFRDRYTGSTLDTGAPMAWRALIKISLDDDTGSKLRNQLVKELEYVGFTKGVNTATWFVEHGDRLDVQEALARVLYMLADPRKFVPTHAALDSLELKIIRV